MHFADPDMYVLIDLVLSDGNLIAYLSSFFQWHDILQVIIPRKSAMAAASSRGGLASQEEGFTTCPICLAPPTAPRMTKCGHVRT